MKLWNNISNDIRWNSSKCSFKRFLDRNLCKKSYYFNCWSRIIFARLRLKCSSLKDHLFQKNIIDSGLCTYGKIETTTHYLLHCPNYIFIRNETIQTLGYIDVQSLIFGNSIKNENENRLVFETIKVHWQNKHIWLTINMECNWSECTWTIHMYIMIIILTTVY